MYKLLIDVLWLLMLYFGLAFAPMQRALANTIAAANGSLDAAILPIVLGGMVSVTTVSIAGSVVRTLVLLNRQHELALNLKREFFLNVALGLPAGWVYFLGAHQYIYNVDAGYVAAQVFSAALCAPVLFQGILTRALGLNKPVKAE